MDRLIIPGTTNGIPFNWDDLDFIVGYGYDGGIIKVLEGILSAYGDNFIIQGCVYSGGNYTEGWLFLDGEILKVEAQAATGTEYWVKQIGNNSNGNKQTQLSGTVDIYKEYRATADESSGSLLADGNEPRLTAPGWTSISLINGWSGGSNYARYRLHGDVVELDAYFNVTDCSPSTDIFGVLPSGYRPVVAKYNSVEDFAYADDYRTRLIINTNGNLDLAYLYSDSGYSFNIRFPVS